MKSALATNTQAKKEIDTYIDDMQQSFVHFARVMKPGAYAIFIIGDSVINDVLHKADDIVRNILRRSASGWTASPTILASPARCSRDRSVERTRKNTSFCCVGRVSPVRK